MIKDHTIDQCLVELARTMAALKALRTRRKNASALTTNSAERDGYCTRQHAAALRASLDLTRKLADLRQGR